MNEIIDKIRKPSFFILLLILNLWFFFAVVFDDRPEIMYPLIVLFFFLSFDYNGIRKEYLCWLLIFVIISALDFNSHKLNVLTPLVLMQCVSRMNFKLYLQYNILILGGTALFMLLSVGLGNMSFGEGADLVRFRHDFGFGHPNVAAMYYWGLFLSLLLYCDLSRYRNLIWILIAVLVLGCFYIYSETVSRGFLTAVIVFIITFGYYTLRSRFRKEYKIRYSLYILYALPILLTVLTIYLSLNADKFLLLDILLSNRLSLYKELLLSITTIQYLIGTSAFDYIVVDSSYLHLMFEAGILLFVYFLWLYYWAIKHIVQQQNFIIIAILVSFLAYGLVESLFLLPMIIGNNLLWILMYRYRHGEDNELNPQENADEGIANQ